MPHHPIEVAGLTKVYDHRSVVEKVSFSVNDAEIFGLLGPNGAGKTTIINMLTGLTRPTSGAIRMLGKELSRTPIEIKRRIGHVYASMAFYSHLTGLQNLQFFGSFYGFARKELNQRIEEALRFVDLWDERKKRAGAYSQGMKQRLGIAKALLHDPQILFFDEATNGIDVKGTNRIRGYLYDLRSQGKTIFVSSHQLDEIELICDRIGLLDEGKLLVLGEPPTIKESLRGVLYKYRIYTSESIEGLNNLAVETRFLGDSHLVIAGRDIIDELSQRFGAGIVEEVEPTLEEAFLWLLGNHHAPGENASAKIPAIHSA